MAGSPITPTFPYKNGQATIAGKGSPIAPYSGSGVLNPYGSNDIGTRANSDFWIQPVYKKSDGTLFCPGVDGPTFASSQWDTVYFSTAPTPGLVEVTVDRERQIDEKKSSGTDGAHVTIHGTKPARIEIRLLIWTPDQWEALKQLWPILMTPPYKTQLKTVTSTSYIPPDSSATTTTASVSGGSVSTTTVPAVATVTTSKKVTTTTPTVFDVAHPIFAHHKIKAVQIIGGHGPDPGPVRGSRIFTIKAIEFLKPGTKNATVTPTQPLQTIYGNPVQQSASIATPGSNSSNTGPA